MKSFCVLFSLQLSSPKIQQTADGLFQVEVAQMWVLLYWFLVQIWIAFSKPFIPSSFCEENSGITFLREAGKPVRSLSGSTTQMGKWHLSNGMFAIVLVVEPIIIQLCTELDI